MRTLVFSDHIEAAIAASRLRSEGYAADICDESVSSLWGPLTVGGVRVFVSEGVELELSSGSEVLSDSDGWADKLLRWVFVMVFLSGIVFCIGGFFSLVISNPEELSLFPVFCSLLAVGSVFALSLIAEPTKRLVRSPLVLGVCAVVLVITKLFIG
ncbi:MAG: hypothetical protein ACSHYB_07190 [Roseibacillus sp.]